MKLAATAAVATADVATAAVAFAPAGLARGSVASAEAFATRGGTTFGAGFASAALQPVAEQAAVCLSLCLQRLLGGFAFVAERNSFRSGSGSGSGGAGCAGFGCGCAGGSACPGCAGPRCAGGSACPGCAGPRCAGGSACAGRAGSGCAGGPACPGCERSAKFAPCRNHLHLTLASSSNTSCRRQWMAKVKGHTSNQTSLSLWQLRSEWAKDPNSKSLAQNNKFQIQMTQQHSHNYRVIES